MASILLGIYPPIWLHSKRLLRIRRERDTKPWRRHCTWHKPIWCLWRIGERLHLIEIRDIVLKLLILLLLSISPTTVTSTTLSLSICHVRLHPHLKILNPKRTQAWPIRRKWWQRLEGETRTLGSPLFMHGRLCPGGLVGCHGICHNCLKKLSPSSTFEPKVFQ
jgi:hypothetical protein